MDIQGFPNYKIFPDGRVWSNISNKYLKHIQGKSPYKFVILIKDGKRNNRMIHRLVAQTFIDNPHNKPHVDHIDRNKINNDVSNLRWVTKSENQQNVGCNSRNRLGIKYIRYEKTQGYIFRRKGCKTKSSRKDLPKMIQYSFFYILKFRDLPPEVESYEEHYL